MSKIALTFVAAALMSSAASGLAAGGVNFNVGLGFGRPCCAAPCYPPPCYAPPAYYAAPPPVYPYPYPYGGAAVVVYPGCPACAY